MIKKLTIAALLWAGLGVAMALDVNQASAQELTQIKGIGASTAERIVEERTNGAFADWADFVKRVKGVGEKKAQSLSDAGLTVGDKAMAAAAAR